jgi:L-lactate utilization protein LutB
MDKPIENFMKIRLEDLKQELEGNNFECHLAPDVETARKLILDDLIPAMKPESISWGGSMTVVASGLYTALKDREDLRVLDTYDKSLTAEQSYELRRQSLLVDLFLTGCNAVTESGQLVNLDMYGNRVGALTFGPRHVIVIVGRNKIVADLKDAIFRIKNYAAPVNAMRLDKKTPCVKTSYCDECKSPDRICNTWTITEKSFPKGRVKVVVVNQDLGF